MSVTSNSANGAMLSPAATKIETFTGGFVDVANPDPETLDLRDIAQGLALTCRYGGHVKRFYSVAEHAVLVHDLLVWQGAGRSLCLAGLFHDAAEAYLGDVVAPLKYAQRQEEFDYPGAFHRASCLGDFTGAYAQLTDRMERAIGERFAVRCPDFDSASMKTTDMWALRIEARALTHTGGAHWRWLGELPNDGELPATVAWVGGRTSLVAVKLWLATCRLYGLEAS